MCSVWLYISDTTFFVRNFVDVSTGNPFDAVNEFISVVNTDGSTVNLEIQRVRRTGVGNIYEITITKSFIGIIRVNATITDEKFSGTLVNALGQYTIEYAGQNFEVGQILNITNGQPDSSETKVKVDSFEMIKIG